MEYGCLDCKRVVQIGLRGSTYSLDDYQWALDQVIESGCLHCKLQW